MLLALKPSLWTIAFLSFRTVLVCVALASLAFWLGRALQLPGLAVNAVEAAGIIVLGRIGFAVLQWASRTYVLTDRRVIRIRGVFTIDIFQCSLGKLQNTFLTLTLPQRFFNLGNIAFTTAGTGGIEAVWRHCRGPLAVHEQLLRTINAASNRPATPPPPVSAP